MSNVCGNVSALCALWRKLGKGGGRQLYSVFGVDGSFGMTYEVYGVECFGALNTEARWRFEFVVLFELSGVA